MNKDLLYKTVLGPPITRFIMTDENREVFAWYGQAVALAQLLENELLACISALPPSSKQRRRQPAKQRVFLERLKDATLGELRQQTGRGGTGKRRGARDGWNAQAASQRRKISIEAQRSRACHDLVV